MTNFTNDRSDHSPHNLINWERIRDILNLRDLPALFRRVGFWAGIIVRSATLIGFILFLNYANDINDMNELVYKGLINFVQLINPYGQTYTLHTFGGPYTQDYFNYPPFAVLLHLPCLLFPGPQSIGTMDFMPCFFVLHVFFDFITYYTLWQSNHSVVSKIIWINPFFVFVDVITFMSLPLMLVTLAISNLDNPFRSGFYSLILAATYQMGAIFIPFILVYHWRRRQLKHNFLGMLGPLVVLFIFILWNPLLFFRDLFIMQIGRPPVNWLDNNPTSPYYNRYYPAAFLFMGSIPSIVFNLAIGLGVPPPIAPQFAPIMMLFFAILGIVALRYFFKYSRKALAIFISGVLLALFIASTAEGLTHYWVLCMTLPFLFWTHRESFFRPVESLEQETSTQSSKSKTPLPKRRSDHD